MLVSFTFRISFECSACRMSLPVNGIAPSLRCYHCGEVNVFDAGWWTQTIEPGHFVEALRFEEGEANESRVMSRRGNYVYAHGKRVPRCQACKGPDLAPEALVAEADDGQAFCPGCGATIRVRLADDLCRAIHPGAKVVVAESIADAVGQAAQAKRQPIIFACMGCGGALRVDGAARTVTCQYCQAPNYLPDGLWNQLNPVPKPHAWFLICELEDRRFPAAAPSFAELAAHAEVAVRMRTAADPACPPDLLARLAQDRDYGVAAATAGNPSTPVAELLRFASYEHDRTWKALLSNATQHAEVLEVLARHPDDRTRRAVAGHPTVPLPVLHALAKDDDRDVKAAARQRLDELKAQGVDVDAGRGLFSKLFG